MTDFSRIADAQRALRHVFLHDMVLQASIGVHGFEHDAPQRIRINVDLGVADDALLLSSRAGARAPGPGEDQLSRVVDYEAVARQVRALVAAGHVRLIETLAERIAEACLADTRVRVARIRVEKLDIFADVEAVGVEIERRAHSPG
jgi:dihydroneopterin aldolase